MVQLTPITAAELAQRASYDRKREATLKDHLLKQARRLKKQAAPAPPIFAPVPSIQEATPEHPVGVLALTAKVEVPLVELMRDREELSDSEILTKYGPRLLEQALDQIERFRTSNEIDPITARERDAYDKRDAQG